MIESVPVSEFRYRSARSRPRAAFVGNAANGEFGDMVEFGILDPTKVTRSALQNAASIAGLVITTEAMIAELPKKEAAADHSHAGGMGGMDF